MVSSNEDRGRSSRVRNTSSLIAGASPSIYRVVLSYGEWKSTHLPRAVIIRVAYSVSSSPGFWRNSLNAVRARSISKFVAYVRNRKLTEEAQFAIP